MASTNRCQDTTHTATISANQTFSIQITGTTSPGVPLHFRVRVH
jgi:hypothetical protein